MDFDDETTRKTKVHSMHTGPNTLYADLSSSEDFLNSLAKSLAKILPYAEWLLCEIKIAATPQIYHYLSTPKPTETSSNQNSITLWS